MRATTTSESIAPAPSAAALWALLCATTAQAPGGDSSANTELLAQQLAANVRYLPLMPLPRTAAQSSETTGSRRKRGSRPSRTNSERGRDFRAKQQRHELSLVQSLTDLQSEVHRLQRISRDLRFECALQTRATDTGSLVRLVWQYHELFHRGSPDVSLPSPSVSETTALVRRQRTFLQHAVDPDLQLGQQRGVGALLELWKRYTKYHAHLRTCADRVVVSGSTANPVIVAHGTMRARYTRETIACLFPHVIANEALVQRFIGKDVTYTYRNTYAFSPDGRLVLYTPEVDFIDALVRAGATLDDVSLLMQQALIADQYIVGPVDSDGAVLPSPATTVELLDGDGCSIPDTAGPIVCEPAEIVAAAEIAVADVPSHRKLCVDYLLT